MTSIAEGHRKLTQIGKIVGMRLDSDEDFGDLGKDPKSVLSLLLKAADGEAQQAS